MDLSTIYKPGEALGGRGANISALLSPLINNAIILTALASFAAVVFAGFNYITSRLRIKRTMLLDGGRQVENESSIRMYCLHELGKILHNAGFRVIEVSGHIHTSGAFFGPDSPSMIILAEKRLE